MPQLDTVEYANIFFKSKKAIDPKDPITMLTVAASVSMFRSILSSNNANRNFNTRKTPADTNVAEWINADAGTGASIESGNQKCINPNTDLQLTAAIRQEYIRIWLACEDRPTSAAKLISS